MEESGNLPLHFFSLGEDELVDDHIVSLRHRAVQRVNFASAQNNVPIIEELAVENPTDEALTDIRIALRAVPPIVREKTWPIDRIAPRGRHTVRDTSISFDIERLQGLNEAEIGELEFRLEARGIQPIVETRRIEFLARDQWGGAGHMAHLLAAFVSPNDPAVGPVLKGAARLLERAGRDGSMNGCQSDDPGRVYMLAGAIWSALTGLALTYGEPPASFEKEGQKIRAPSRIVDEGLATCLDAALFLAATFEAAGLNPVVLFSEGHAWVGVWLRKRDFGHVTEPDVVAVRKAVHANELKAIETTLLTRRPSIGFEQAVDEGRRRLDEKREPEFVVAVDIARARAADIQPLASHRISAPSDSGEPGAPDETAPAALPPMPGFGQLPADIVPDAPATPQGRIERWQGKLLDLTLRNRLLNYGDGKPLPLLCPSVAALEDELAAGKKFRGFSLNDNRPPVRRTLFPEEAQRIDEEIVRDAFEKRHVAVQLTSKEMKARLLTLYRRARSDMQEGGTNTLFLAAGFLCWKKKDDDTRTFRAPLLLIPIKLERHSASAPFQISHHEDEGRVNLTLLEFLKQDFDLRIPQLEGELPRDGSGIDVRLIFDVMRQAVYDVPGFEVVEDLALSIFSFAKYLMWKDLVDRTDQLRQNRLVNHLIDGATETYGDLERGALIEPKDIDRRCLPRDLLTPLPADSSQLAAVLAASQGRDFVLVGPPGTGKSQTIVNIIAQCLGEGKTVLFVAEKAAALEVVHRRLVSAGLGDAVLELHSNKTDRKSVLAQLGRSWDRASGSTDEEWIKVNEELRLSRNRLNAYVEALHAKGEQGFSVFDAVASVVQGKPPFELSFASKDAHDRQSYSRLAKLAAELGRTHAAVRAGPPLSLIRREERSLLWEADLLKAIDSLRGALGDLMLAEYALARQFGLREDPKLEAARRTCLKALAPRADRGALDLSSVPDMPAKRLVASAQSLAGDVKALDAASSRIVATYPLDAIRRMPLEQLDADWRKAQAKIWPASAFARRKVRKLLQTYADSGAADPSRDLKALLAVHDRDAAIRKNPLTPVAESGGRVDPDRSSEAVRQAIEYRAALTDLNSDVEDSHRFEDATSALASATGSAVLDALQSYLAAEHAADERIREFVRLDGAWPEESSVADVDVGLASVQENSARIGDWVGWVRIRKESEAAGLAPLVKALEGGKIKDAAQAFERAYAAWWLPLAMEARDELRDFARWQHEDLIETFRDLDNRAARLAPVEVMRRITHGLPAKDGVPKKSELGTLRHQINLRRPSMPIRQLLARLPTTFGKLAPCVLMSPLSIAQYLPTDHAAFDLIIFDEASQIPTWDAIGAIARSRQTIIVGDPKQLPPTNFFGRRDDDDDSMPADERDMPSILDELSAAGVPHRYLDWHYRSRDEALIAFSNHRYYDDRLVTFPAPFADSGAIEFHRVKGTYVPGRENRTNQAEAKAVVDLVRQRLTDWLELPEEKRQTLGIITFNAEQQSLILDLLDDIRRNDKAFEWFFADEREEPVIVKNLENIQGDERDVMLFSVTFGPDIAGKLAMNFGPLNNAGGERRLNVAITRARREFHVFSSIRAEQIDRARIRAEGVRDLKAFLDYAERGPDALPRRDGGSLGPPESPFEKAVADALGAKGWEVRTQIGVSGFRVDLGVVHPDHAGRYLAGIECDGARYHSSATARDRDKIRQAVLEGLGWTILRVWSTDWFQRPSHVTDLIHRQLVERLAEDRQRARAARDTEAETTPQVSSEHRHDHEPETT